MSSDFEIKDGILVLYRGSDAHVVIPDGVTMIGKDAFKGNTSLTSIIIPDSVMTIGENAFFNCKSLMSIEMPDSVTEIGAFAFFSCKSLMFIEIPDSVTTIGEGAFKDCTSLMFIEIPDSVTEIGKRAFLNCGRLTSIKIPDSVTEIGDSVFSNCKRLTSIEIPDSVTEIGGSAFAHCTSLMSIEIPDSVTEIGGFAFSYCGSLTSIEIPDSVTKIGFCTFASCSSLTSIKIPDSVTTMHTTTFSLCPKLTIICREGSYAHQYCDRNRYNYIFDYQYEAYHGVLPPGIEKLQSPFLADEEKPYIFVSYSHKDRDVVLGIIKELYETGWRIWYDEGLTIGDRYDETLEEHVRNCAAFLLFVTKQSVNSSYIRLNEIPWAEESDKSVVKCILDEGTDIEVKEDSVAATVGRGEIEPALKKIDGLTQGERRKAKGISVVVDPANRSEADGDGFAYCLYSSQSTATAKAILLEAKNGGCKLYDAAESGEDDEKLKSCACLIVFIDKSFFSDAHLTKILIEAYQAKKDIAICQLEDLADKDLPQELLGLQKMQWLNFVHGLTGDMNTKLARHLQKRGCRNIAVLPGFEYIVTEKEFIIIRYTGVEKEPRLESEYGGVPVAKIDRRAFQNCIHLEKIVIPNGITEIGESAFEGCSNLTTVELPDSVTEIGYSAFKFCKNLMSIIIPDSVTEIGDSVFSNCKRLTSIEIPGSVTEIGDFAFYSCKSLTSIIIPDRVTEIGAYAFSDCTSLTSIEIPDSVTKIGKSAFKGCSSLTSIKIPDSVTKIGEEAFRGCNLLTVICSPDSYAREYCVENYIPV